MNLTETPLSQEYKYKGRIINLRVDEARLPNGAKATREVIEHPGGVCVAALTDEGELLFVRQFRYPYRRSSPKSPAGKLTPGEVRWNGGKRELQEETAPPPRGTSSWASCTPLPATAGRLSTCTWPPA